MHHTNEIAQSEAAFGHKWVDYWFHTEFLIMKEGKMSKSAGGFVTLAALAEKGFSPEDYRYLCLQAHYRSPLQFTWEALRGAQSALANLRSLYTGWLEELAAADTETSIATSAEVSEDERAYRDAFDSAIASDLNVPLALGVVWKMARDPALAAATKRSLLSRFDRILGLGVDKWRRAELPEELKRLLDERDAARARRDYATADELRARLAAAGVEIMDTPSGTKWQINPKR